MKYCFGTAETTHPYERLVAEQRELPGVENCVKPDGLRRFRYKTGSALNGIAVKRFNHLGNLLIERS